MMREKLEAALVVYEAMRKNYRDSDLMRSQAGYDLSKRVRAILAAAPTDGALSASELEVAVHRNMEVPSIREAVVQAAIQWYCADDDFIDVRSEWLEKAVRALPEFTGDDLSPPSSWPTNEAESEAETKRALAPNEQVQVRVEPHGPAPAANTEGLRKALIEWLDKLNPDDLYRGWFLRSLLRGMVDDPAAWQKLDAALRGEGEPPEPDLNADGPAERAHRQAEARRSK